MKLRAAALPLWRPECWLATWFGSGLMPVAPGTWGSLAALPFAWIIAWVGGVWALAAATLAISLIGWWSAGAYARASDRDDPGDVVIDEVAGQWLVLLPAGTDIGLFALGFVLFRLLDITKPWPARWADRTIHGGLGIMLDDLIVAVYGAPAVYVAALFLGAG